MAFEKCPPRFILLTRPHEDSLRLSHKLEGMGYRCLIDPLLKIDYFKSFPRLDTKEIIFNEENELISPSLPQACLISSKNAAPALKTFNIPLTMPIFVVGSTTRYAVQNQGYHKIIEGDGNGSSLLPKILSHLKVNNGPILHLCGLDIRFDFENPLKAAGYIYYKEIVYRTLSADSFCPATIKALQHNLIRAVLFFSPKTVRCFNALAQEFPSQFQRTSAICLSSSIAETLQIPFNNIIVSKHSDENAMLAALKSELKRDG